MVNREGGAKMVYYTGDTHGKFDKIVQAFYSGMLTVNDTLVILGDAGFNYYGNMRGDIPKKQQVNRLGLKVLCIQGNHEERPSNISTYQTKRFCGGSVWYEPEYPNILFAKDGDVYNLDGKRSIVIGGAYSVDKFYRIKHGSKWFRDEQPSDKIKSRVEKKLAALNWNVDQVLSHTCPQKYTPVETFLPGIDQSKVDKSTEIWLDIIEDRLTYQRWLCGHWHIDKTIDSLRFVMHDIIL